MIADRLDRLGKWLVARFGGLELLQLVLLWFTLGSAGQGLAGVVSGLPPGFMPVLVPVSVLSSWVLTRTRLPGWKYGLTGVLLGLVGLMLTVGKMGRALLSILVSTFPIIRQVFQDHMLDLSPVVTAWQAMQEMLRVLAARFGNWFHTLQSPAPLNDPLVTTLLCGMVVWLVTFWALWWGRRRENMLVGLFPVMFFLAYFIFLNHAVATIPWLVLVGGGIFLVQAASHYDISSRRWLKSRMERVEIEPALALSVAVIAGVMMLAGGLLPAISFEKLHKVIDEFLQAEQSQTKTGEAGPRTISGIPSSTSAHIISAGPELSQEIVMYVSVEGYAPPPPVTEAYVRILEQSDRYYWRAQTYDYYTGHGWLVTTTAAETLPAYQVLLPDVDLNALPENFKLVTQHVQRVESGVRTVFAVGELLDVDRPSTVLRRTTHDLVSAQVDSDIYAATSRIQSLGVEQLRNTGTDYPASMRRYLELPDTLPQRVRDLALSLTAGQPTAYDKVSVLQAYLRQFPYSRDVPAPPADRDSVDYFLFDLKMGYCDYFASAMVVMARSAGLPARLVIGYTSGTYSDTEGRFTVRASNAHAWVEVYFPDIGWVEFEPTSSQSIFYRPGQETESSQTVSLPPPGQEAPLRFRFGRIWAGWLSQVLLAIGSVILLLLLLPLEAWWLSLLPVERALKIIFQRLYRCGHSLGIHPDSSRTPNEFALVLLTGLERFALDKKVTGLIVSLRADLDGLTCLYNRLLFSKYALQEREKKSAIRMWRKVRRGLGKLWWRGVFRRSLIPS